MPGSAIPNVVPSRSALRVPQATVEPAGGDSSWMAPEAKSEDLLYVANAYTVTVYSYPVGKHVGTLRGFYRPEFECSDKRGDVFITEGGAVFEYPHGGKKRTQTFTMSGYFANDCASDPTTGDLAIAWEHGRSKSYLAIYHHASGTPISYSKGGIQFLFCGYDSIGDLFADGFVGVPGRTVLVELPKGGSALKTVTFHQTLGGDPGPVQWDGKYVAVGDQANDTIYRFTVSSFKATLEGKTVLKGAQTLVQWWIVGSRVVGPDDVPSKVWYWAYPRGGSPTKVITKAVGAPAGVTVSRANP